MCRGSLIVLIVTYIAALPAQASEDAVLNSFITRLAQLKSDHISIASKTQDAFIPAMESIRKSEGLDAMIILWQNNHRVYVELAWWRSPYRSTRLLALALFYNEYTDTDISFFPRFKQDAERFNENERKERLEEIIYIEDHLPIIKSCLKSILVSPDLKMHSVLTLDSPSALSPTDSPGNTK